MSRPAVVEPFVSKNALNLRPTQSEEVYPRGACPFEPGAMGIAKHR